MSPKRIGNGVKSSKGGNSIYIGPAGGVGGADAGGVCLLSIGGLCPVSYQGRGIPIGVCSFLPYIYTRGVLNKCAVKSRCGGFCYGWISVNRPSPFTQFLSSHSSLFFSFAHTQSFNDAILITS